MAPPTPPWSQVSEAQSFEADLKIISVIKRIQSEVNGYNWDGNSNVRNLNVGRGRTLVLKNRGGKLLLFHLLQRAIREEYPLFTLLY